MYRKALISTAAGVLIWGLYKLTNEAAQPASGDDDALYFNDIRARSRRRSVRPALEEARDAFDERMRDVIKQRKAA
jgi:hypothetical protein